MVSSTEAFKREWGRLLNVNIFFYEREELLRRNGIMKGLFQQDLQPLRIFRGTRQYAVGEMEGSVPQCRWKFFTDTRSWSRDDYEAIYNW